MVIGIILTVLSVADTVCMGYYYCTQGQLYGLDYLLTGHDFIGEGIDALIGADPTVMSADQYQQLIDVATDIQTLLGALIVTVAAIGLLLLMKPRKSVRHTR